MRLSAGLELVEDALPDETTILNFRHLLEAHQLTAQLLNTTDDELTELCLLLKDATIIHAPSSIKNADQARDTEMYQSKKGNQWYSGMKLHVDSDLNSGLVHILSVTPVNPTHISQLPDLLREDNRADFGHKGYVGNTPNLAARKTGGCRGVELKGTKQHPLTAMNKQTNRERSSICSRVVHIFRVMKRQFGYTKVRYRGLVKHAAQVFTLIGLTNLFPVRRRIVA